MSTYSTYNDQGLLVALAADDAVAFRELYDRYWKLLFVTANNILQNSSSAQDIVQEVFMSVWQRRAVLEIQSLKPWLLQATRFQVLKAIRAEKTDAAFYDRLSQVSQSIMIDNPVMFKELQHILQQLIQSLPAEQQAIFRMSREENLTYREIAGRLGISVKTVEKKISQSLRHIRFGLDDAALTLVAGAAISSLV